MSDDKRARVALVLGDPAGIGPELVAKLFADPANRAYGAALIIADEQELKVGMRIAGCTFRYRVVADPGEILASPDVPLLIDYRGSARQPFEYMKATANGGRYVLDTMAMAAELTQRGVTDAVCFAPLNKSAMHMTGIPETDELTWFANKLGYHGPHAELNSLENLWTARVTSHVALKDVSNLLTPEKIATAAEMIHGVLVDAGMPNPRIAVCGLNPHNGDNGAFGREEIDIIAPGIKLAHARGIPAQGPYPADTIFLKARNGEVDAVVTMYHDQGQIAMKLLGFESGVTLLGGFPFPICTPAHGTAYDIAGRGIANIGATRAAVLLAAEMARRKGA